MRPIAKAPLRPLSQRATTSSARFPPERLVPALKPVSAGVKNNFSRPKKFPERLQIFKLMVHELLVAGNGVSMEQFENIRDFLRDQTLKDQYTFLSFDQYEDQ